MDLYSAGLALFRKRVWPIVLSMVCMPLSVASELPVIDAHSQFDHEISPQRVISTLQAAGVRKVLLATRGRAEIKTLTNLARKHPGCVIPMVRTKSTAYALGNKGYYRQLEEQLAEPLFRAMAEIILTHNQKGDRAEEVYLPASSPQVEAAISAGKARQWPVVLHYEFRWIAQELGKSELQSKLNELQSVLRMLAPVPVGLTHVAQLDSEQARLLLQAHPNLFLLLSHANSLINDSSKQPWTNIVQGGSLDPAWKALMLEYPGQFVLAFDNVFPEHWSELYARQVTIWRQALAELPPNLAGSIAHDNAVRIYRLDSVGQICPSSGH